MNIYSHSIHIIINLIIYLSSSILFQKHKFTSAEISSSFFEISDDMVKSAGQPTLLPNIRNISCDVHTLNKAIEKEDYTSIVNVLGKRTNDERMQILNLYKKRFPGKFSLVDDYGERFMIALSMKESDANFYFLSDAFGNNDTKFIIQYFLDTTNDSRIDLSYNYEDVMGNTLEHELVDIKDGVLKSALHHLIENDEMDKVKICKSNLVDMFKSHDYEFDHSDDLTNYLLHCEPENILISLFKLEDIYNKTILEIMKTEFSEEYIYFVKTVIQIIMNRYETLAEWLNEWINIDNRSKEHNIAQLIGFLTKHAEVDLVQIKEKYQRILKDMPIKAKVLSVWDNYIGQLILNLLNEN